MVNSRCARSTEFLMLAGTSGSKDSPLSAVNIAASQGSSDWAAATAGNDGSALVAVLSVIVATAGCLVSNSGILLRTSAFALSVPFLYFTTMLRCWRAKAHLVSLGFCHAFADLVPSKICFNAAWSVINVKGTEPCK